MSSNYLAPSPRELDRDWDLALALAGRWDIDVACGEVAPIIRRAANGRREAVLARFGFVDAASASPRAAAASVNVKAETADVRAAFKDAYAARQWCIVPARAFYVPLFANDDAGPERYCIRRKDGAPLAIAGLWRDTRLQRDGDAALDGDDRDDEIDGDRRPAIDVRFALLTVNCDLHPLLSRFGPRASNDGGDVDRRTPALLGDEDVDDWLASTVGRAPIFMGTFGAADLDASPAPSNARGAAALVPLASSFAEL